MRLAHPVVVALLAAATVTSPHVFFAQSSTNKPLWAESGTDVSGAASRDGRLLTYIDWSSGDLGLRDLTAGTNRLLTKAADFGKSSYAVALQRPQEVGSASGSSGATWVCNNNASHIEVVTPAEE